MATTGTATIVDQCKDSPEAAARGGVGVRGLGRTSTTAQLRKGSEDCMGYLLL